MVSQKIKQYLIEPAIVGAAVVIGTSVLTPLIPAMVPAVVEVASLSLRTLITATASAIAGSMLANLASKKL